MFIWLDASVLTADLALDSDACHGISEIFGAVFRGEHFALGSRDTLGTLAANTNLASGTRTIISTIRANLSLIGSITSTIATRVVVTHGMAARCTKRGASEWEIPLKEVGIHCVRKSVLLTENLDDAKMYEHAAKQYQASVQIGGQIALEKALGGGSTTPEALKNLACAENRWCLCITDSDRLCPEDNMNTTAQRCNEIAQNESIVATHIDLAARELENTIPLVFVGEAIPPTHQERWEWHVDKLYRLRPDAHSYCDIKLGTTFRNILSYTRDSYRRKYWDSVTADLNKASALAIDCPDSVECLGANGCENDEVPCVGYVANSFGEKLVSAILQNLDKRSPHNAEKQTRHDPNRQEWMAIGRSVFEWAYAPAKTRL